MRRTIGLTGGIGSGKSTVARAWVDCGATLVDTDAIAHELTADGGAAIAPLREAFGADAITAQGALDRARLRALVFGDAQAKRRLETILHPLIAAQAMQQADHGGAVVVFDVPLLAESPAWRARCDRILVVDCDEATQVERVAARSGWSPAQVRDVIAQQAPRARRRAIADAVIFNQGLTLPQLQEQVRQLWARWTDRPAPPPRPAGAAAL